MMTVGQAAPPEPGCGEGGHQHAARTGAAVWWGQWTQPFHIKENEAGHGGTYLNPSTREAETGG